MSYYGVGVIWILEQRDEAWLRTKEKSSFARSYGKPEHHAFKWVFDEGREGTPQVHLECTRSVDQLRPQYLGACNG
jgi:hypothetical protein